MDKIKEIDLISENGRYLLDYANLKSNLIDQNYEFLDHEGLYEYYNDPIRGMPILMPVGIEEFDYSKSKSEFQVDKKEFAKKIFQTNNVNYVGVKKYFQFGNIFCTGSIPKKENLDLINKLIKINDELISLVSKLKSEGKKIISFQTRNIPHLGHEKIIEMLLEKFDIVIVNPVIGPKKSGDIKNDVLYKVFNYLSDKHYDNRIIFKPICANMFYGGPREAIHHAFLRRNVGFPSFVVGRDHAGAENNFGPEEAINTIRSVENEIGINIITHMGSYYNNSTKKIVIKDQSNKEDELLNISGTEFRECIKKKNFFIHARKELQDFLLSYEGDLFY